MSQSPYLSGKGFLFCLRKGQKNLAAPKSEPQGSGIARKEKGMRVPLKTRYEMALDTARHFGARNEEEEKRVAKHIFARMISGRATIGNVNGRFVINKKRIRPSLP
ncbi:MAG: hypothetical protein A4E53_01513 [Pelotomaculum sp. PtaB.Bin104]|nr:MAG: hypothetical protein A4E53_01513 [Pelotomaculum sp. PtaB.Bin104]